jgi:hypothetical protein
MQEKDEDAGEDKLEGSIQASIQLGIELLGGESAVRCPPMPIRSLPLASTFAAICARMA